MNLFRWVIESVGNLIETRLKVNFIATELPLSEKIEIINE